MERFKSQLCRDEYEVAKALCDKNDKVGRFGEASVYGYGIYRWSVYERNGKYFEEYSSGSSCE